MFYSHGGALTAALVAASLQGALHRTQNEMTSITDSDSCTENASASPGNFTFFCFSQSPLLYIYILCCSNFLFFRLWLLLSFKCHSSRQRLGCHGTTAALQAFPFVTATNGASSCGFVSVRACVYAKSEQRHTLSSKLYTRTWLNMTSSGTCLALYMEPECFFESIVQVKTLQNFL